MCENTEVSYLDGEVVWVKLGSCWWPGEVVGPEKLPPDVLPSFRKPPIAVVKFFQEDTYEYVKNASSIFKYECSRKNEFINKGLYMFRTKRGHMEKFPEDVIRAETAVGGDIEILTRDEFQEQKKESYAGIFGDPQKKTPGSNKKGRGGRGRSAEPTRLSTPFRKGKEKVDYKVHILVQGTKPSSDNGTAEPTTPTPSTSADAGSDSKDDIVQDTEETEKQEKIDEPTPSCSTPTASTSAASTPTSSSSGIYSCHACPFTTTRLNVLILHNKTHSVSFTPYTPSPVRKKLTTKLSAKSIPDKNKTPKPRKPRKEKTEKEPKKATASNKKRVAEEETNNTETKKVKTDQEIKSSLLADWDDGDEESNDESSITVMAGSPEVPEAAESPAVPTSAELSSVQLLNELSSPTEKKSNSSPASEKPESSSDSKYEFCEDEDWPLEADGGRKIPRVKNPKRKEDTKSISLDDDDMAREVAELLNKTTVPDLPSAPEPLKVEENFPEPSIVKSPDKQEKVPEKSELPQAETPPTKAIFKTKTFFRSRHSRSQDAIGKYVAEQLNAVEKMDISESELNGSEVVSSPEARESPPIEHVKVARLAPKIQLKKMKAELREKEKNNFENFGDISDFRQYTDMAVPSKTSPPSITSPTLKDKGSRILQDVLYPTQEIKPVNTDLPEPVKSNIHRADIIEEATNKTDILGFTTKKPENKEIRTHEIENIDINIKAKVIDDVSHLKETIHYGDTINIIKVTNETPNKIEDIVNKNKSEITEDGINRLEKTDDNTNLMNEDLMDHELTKDHNMEASFNKVDEVELSEHVHETATEEVIDEKMDDENINELVDDQVAQVEEKDTNATQKLVDEIEKPVQSAPIIPESPKKSYSGPYMNESTASAVDALLSVSREADRVTRVISDDPPEDLFEDDNKDNSGPSNDNDFLDSVNLDTSANGVKYAEPEKYLQGNTEIVSDMNIITSEVNSEVVEETVSMSDENNLTRLNDMDTVTADQNEANNDLNENVETSVIDNTSNNVAENIPSESDLQIAETLINLPSAAIQNKTHTTIPAKKSKLSKDVIQEDLPSTYSTESMVIEDKPEESNIEPEPVSQTKSLLISNNENIMRFETEQEKSENLNAAQSLVQMSESIDHKINIDHNLSSTVNNNKESPSGESLSKGLFNVKQNNSVTVEQKLAVMSNDNKSENTNGKSTKMDTSSSKLLKILEEPCTPKISTNKPASTKTIITGKEKILNFDVAKSSFKSKPESPKQKIIIRRTAPNKNIINNMSEITTPEKIILSRSNNPAQDGTVQTYTIQTSAETPSDANTIIFQQKIRKIAKPPAKIQKIKPSNSLIPPLNETSKVINDSTGDEAMFDINSMPIVLSEDLLTPENIEKMPIVMSDGNIITHTPNPPKLVKTKQTVESEKIAISGTPNKPEMKTLLMNPVSEVNKVSVNTPNILSKSSKLRGAKPMLVIDKTTGKQKIIMTKGESSVKEVKQTPTLLQTVPQTTAKSEKFIILPTPSSPRPGRTQKIVIDPQTGKAHVLVAKGSEPQLTSSDNKPVSAKLIPSSTDASSPGNTVMIITNAQGAQSRIVLTPEHEKMLFPKKQQPNVSQLKTITHRISTNTGAAQKTIVTTIASGKTQNAGPVKTQARLGAKQKSAIITSKGQLIVGGRVTTTTQNIAPMPEIRPVPKRIMASEPRKLVQTIQKTSSEPLIFLQQKSGAVMQLTAAQFEHLQRTGQIVQKTAAPPVQENKVVVQKTITISPNEAGVTTVHKPRVRKTVTESPSPVKKMKQEIAIAPAPATLSPMPPALTPFSNPNPPIVPSVSNTVSVATTNAYPEFDNFEELLPSTAIVRQQQEPVVSTVAQPEPAAAPPAALGDSQLLAVPGEHFGGPVGSFYLCIEDNGTLTPVDNRPLVLDNNQLVPMHAEPLPVLSSQPERRDILEAALANSDVFHADTARDDAPDFRDLNANVSVHCRVSETSTTLNQPIMTPVEVPTKGDSEPAVPSNLEDGLAVIGVTPPTIPTSLELPITVTDPRIAPAKTTDPLSNNNYGTSTALLPSPSTEMSFVTSEEADVPIGGPISMPLLTEEDSVGKSMPILTDDIAERTVSSVDSAVGSPSSIDVRESETEDGGQWTRRLLTPGSDTSEASAEIPLQPAIQLSVSELPRHS
nr:titin [Helicoverpa armigera]